MSNSFTRRNAAGPCCTAGAESAAWWLLDLSSGYSLAANYYAICHDDSSAFPRSWDFQVYICSVFGRLSLTSEAAA